MIFSFLKQNFWFVLFVIFIVVLNLSTKGLMLQTSGVISVKGQIVENPLLLLSVIWPIPFLVLLFFASKQFMKLVWFENIVNKIMDFKIVKIFGKNSSFFRFSYSYKSIICIFLTYGLTVLTAAPFMIIINRYW